MVSIFPAAFLFGASHEASSNQELPLIRIPDPYPIKWENLSGDTRKRFCDACEKQGINFSEYTAEETLGEMDSLVQKAQATSHPKLFFLPEETRDPSYLLKFVVPSKDSSLVFGKFKRSFSTPSKVYTELLLVTKYKQLNELDDYDYGIYQDGKLAEARNKLYGKQLTDAVPPIGQTNVVKHTSRRSELLYHAPANIVIKIGKDTGGYIKPLSLFSYVFTLLAVAVLIFGAINYLTNALPGPLNFLRTSKPSLRNQFQFASWQT